MGGSATQSPCRQAGAEFKRRARPDAVCRARPYVVAMRVFLTTAGSRGDVQPYLALALGLQTAGHDVTLSSARRFAPLAEAHGVPYAPTSDALLDLMDEPAARHALETMSSLGQAVRQLPRLVRLAGAVQAELIDATWDAVQVARPDAVVFHPKAYWGPSFAAALGARAVRAPLQPFYVPTGEVPLPGAPRLPLGPRYNRLTYRAVQAGIAVSARRYLADWRRATGARPPGGSVPTVHGFSRHVVPEPADWPADATTAGFWGLDQPAGLSAEVEAFLAAGAPPVHVGFGSMIGRDPEGLTRLVAEALRRAGVRGILATGWGGLDAETRGDGLLVIEGAPHEALFPRCAAVVHHGGAGTTAAGLRAGRPTVICPFFGDQPFWGRRVEALGVGPAPARIATLSAAALASNVRSAVGNEAVRKRAEVLGEKLRAEDGVGTAVDVIEASCRPGALA